MPMPRKARLALTAIAATAVTVTVAPASFATAGRAAVSGSAVRSAADPTPAATPLPFSPVLSKTSGPADEYSVAFAGPGCDAFGGGNCIDPTLPATGVTWSLGVVDLAGTMSQTLPAAYGNGNSLSETPVKYTFPTPAVGSSGTWKVTLTSTYLQTDESGVTTLVTRSSSTLIDYGTATAAPVAPQTSIDRTEVPAGVQLTFTSQVSRYAPGSKLVVDFGDGSAQVTPPITGPSTTFKHAYPATKTSYTAWVAVTDGANQGPWIPVTVPNVTAAKAVLAVSPTSGTASSIEPLKVKLDLSHSSSATSGATIATYSFDCGSPSAVQDGAGTGVATCTYTTPGTYAVSGQVTDSNGSTSHSLPQTVTVGAGPAYLPPALGQFGVSLNPSTAPLGVVADVSRVRLDPHADPAKATYTINWGDGKQDTFTKATMPVNGRVFHVYDGFGSYNVELTVNDGLGQTGSTQNLSVRVTVSEPPKGPTLVARVAGADRYDTGVHVSRSRWADASDTKASAFLHPDSVILATGGGFADALAGVPFSVYKNGALLLTAPNQLTPEVRDEIKRILPVDGKHTVYVLGGTAALSPSVAAAITGMGYRVQRIAGADRYDTALQIAHAMGDPATTVVARGDDFADALSAGPLASDLFGTGSGTAYVPAAIVLSDNKTVTAGTKSYLASRFAGRQGLSVIAVGGGAAQALTGVPGFDGTSPRRNSGQLTGDDRYETASKVAAVFQLADPAAPVGVATGLAYPDALTGGAFMASIGGPLLLTDPKTPSAAMTGSLAQRADSTVGVFVFGGPNAVAPAIVDRIVAIVHGVSKQF